MKILLLPCLGSMILSGCQASSGGADSVDSSQVDKISGVQHPENGEFSFVAKDHPRVSTLGGESLPTPSVKSSSVVLLFSPANNAGLLTCT